MAHLQKLPQSCDNAAPNELSNIHARGTNAHWVSASDAINPLHGQHTGTAQVPAHPGDFDLGIIAKVSVEVLQARNTYQQLAICFVTAAVSAATTGAYYCVMPLLHSMKVSSLVMMCRHTSTHASAARRRRLFCIRNSKLQCP